MSSEPTPSPCPPIREKPRPQHVYAEQPDFDVLFALVDPLLRNMDTEYMDVDPFDREDFRWTMKYFRGANRHEIRVHARWDPARNDHRLEIFAWYSCGLTVHSEILKRIRAALTSSPPTAAALTPVSNCLPPPPMPPGFDTEDRFFQGILSRLDREETTTSKGHALSLRLERACYLCNLAFSEEDKTRLSSRPPVLERVVAETCKILPDDGDGDGDDSKKSLIEILRDGRCVDDTWHGVCFSQTCASASEIAIMAASSFLARENFARAFAAQPKFVSLLVDIVLVSASADLFPMARTAMCLRRAALALAFLAQHTETRGILRAALQDRGLDSSESFQRECVARITWDERTQGFAAQGHLCF